MECESRHPYIGADLAPAVHVHKATSQRKVRSTRWPTHLYLRLTGTRTHKRPRAALQPQAVEVAVIHGR